MKGSKYLSIIISTSLLFLTVVYIGISVASAAAGDASDPIVTKSYVDTQIATEVSKAIESATAAQNTENDNKYVTSSDVKDAIESVISPIPFGYKVINLAVGQTIVGFEGTEFIIKTGSVSLNSGSDTVGLYDLTSASSVGNAATLVQNHYYIFQKESRGVSANTVTELLIRGKYTIG